MAVVAVTETESALMVTHALVVNVESPVVAELAGAAADVIW
jgi:hypothetical protein